MDRKETSVAASDARILRTFPLIRRRRSIVGLVLPAAEQMTAQERQFRFWRLIRHAESELWAIGHPEAKRAKEKNNDRVGFERHSREQATTRKY